MPAAVLTAAGFAISGCHLFDAIIGRHSAAIKFAWLVPGVGAAAPAFDGSTAYFVGRDHNVYALDAEAGHQRWVSSTGFSKQPSPSGNCVIVSDLVACDDDAIAAFRRSDGTRVWQFEGSGDHPGVFPLVVQDGRILAGSYNGGTMYAVDAATGVPAWTAPVFASDANDVGFKSVAADSDIVAAAFVRPGNPYTGGVLALDAATGAVRWVTEFPVAKPDSDCGGFSVALWQGSVLASSLDGKIYIVDRVTGAIQSFFPGAGQFAPGTGVTGPIGEDIRSITISNNTLFAASTGAWFIAYDLQSRKELWRIASRNGGALGNFLVADGAAVYVREANSYLAAYSETSPKNLWNVGHPDPLVLTTSVAVSDNMIFGSGTQGFWAIRKP